MELAELRAKAAELFPAAVRFAVENPRVVNPSLEEFNNLCAANFGALGFSCHADLFSELVPKVQGRLTLDAWSEAELEVAGWNVKVTMRPFYLGAGYVHFQVIHDGPIAGFTETGYRSHFTPLVTFAEFTPEEYLALVIGTRPREQQLSLF